MSDLDEWTESAIEQAFQQLANETGEKPFAWYPVVRFAVSGTNSGPDFLPMVEHMGKELVIRRSNDRLASIN